MFLNAAFVDKWNFALCSRVAIEWNTATLLEPCDDSPAAAAAAAPNDIATVLLTLRLHDITWTADWQVADNIYLGHGGHVLHKAALMCVYHERQGDHKIMVNCEWIQTDKRVSWRPSKTVGKSSVVRRKQKTFKVTAATGRVLATMRSLRPFLLETGMIEILGLNLWPNRVISRRRGLRHAVMFTSMRLDISNLSEPRRTQSWFLRDLDVVNLFIRQVHLSHWTVAMTIVKSVAYMRRFFDVICRQRLAVDVY